MMTQLESTDEKERVLRRGWTTGACATAAVKSALPALFGGSFVDPVQIILPGGQQPFFALAHEDSGDDWVTAGVIKDAGDDPDVTHGALVWARLRRGQPHSGIVFEAGAGVGTVTKPGLPVPPGEPAINPVPRKMIGDTIAQFCAENAIAADIVVEIGVRDGEFLAQKTWNPRLGIVGGLSILGTTGIVVPYSCSAWIHSIHSGIEVARALGLTHVVGSTGDRSEKSAMAALDLPSEAYLDMGDFAGGMLKYLRKHPVPHVTIAGGFGKLSKLAQGAMDLHSGRSQVDTMHLWQIAKAGGANAQLLETMRRCETAAQTLAAAQNHNFALADLVAKAAREKAQNLLGNAPVTAHILVIERTGAIVGRA